MTDFERRARFAAFEYQKSTLHENQILMLQQLSAESAHELFPHLLGNLKAFEAGALWAKAECEEILENNQITMQRDLATIKRMWADQERWFKERTALRAQIAEYVKALEFYAKKDSWNKSEHCDYETIIEDDLESIERQLNSNQLAKDCYGGKRARAVIAKFKLEK